MGAADSEPAHPGAVLHAEFLVPRKLSQGQLAKALGVTRPLVSLIIQGKRRVSPDVAVRLARFLGTTPEYWLQLQNAWDLYQSSRPAPPAGARHRTRRGTGRPDDRRQAEIQFVQGPGERELRVRVVREVEPPTLPAAAPPSPATQDGGPCAEGASGGLAPVAGATEQAPLRVDHDGRVFSLWVESPQALPADSPTAPPRAQWIVSVDGNRERLCWSDGVPITAGELRARVAVWWARRNGSPDRERGNDSSA
jgi:addiction module HigA family antidote